LGPLPGPLTVAIAVAAGIAAAPLLDQLGVAPWVRWLIVGVAIAIAASRRHRAIVLAAGLAPGFSLGAASGGRTVVPRPDGVVIDDRLADRRTGVVRGPIAHGPLGDGALLDTGGAAIWLWTEQPLVPGERVTATGVVHTPRGLRDPA